ncbi:NAD-dependent epimerase/dehydratase family protein [Roseibium sp.]|uniref:NAD-dependent epimerase/dehydratase family protein n=1 Tax=Roseibium sp. TaxID=1936156 RepID=UPI0032985588
MAIELQEALFELAGETVLVTGASGFLMGFLVDVLCAWNDLDLAQPIHVIALDNHMTGKPIRLAHLDRRPDVTICAHDVTENYTPDRPVHRIVHGASIASPMVYRQFPLETIDANVGGTRNMLELARAQKVRGMLVMSTSEIYGDPEPDMIPTPEDYRGSVSCTGPRACYDESKRLAETLATVYAKKFGLPVVSIRPFNVYGPDFRLDDQRVLPDFISAALAGQSIVLLSDGRPTRTFCYVTDAVRAMLLLLIHGDAGEAYNVGNDLGEISMLDLARQVAKSGADVLGSEIVEVQFQQSADPDYLVDNPNRRCPDLTKIRAAIRWSPAVSLPDGLRRMITSYVEPESHGL